VPGPGACVACAWLVRGSCLGRGSDCPTRPFDHEPETASRCGCGRRLGRLASAGASADVSWHGSAAGPWACCLGHALGLLPWARAVRESVRWHACCCRDCWCADLAIPKSFCTYTMNSLHLEKSFRDKGVEVSCGEAGVRCRVTLGAEGTPEARGRVRRGRRSGSHPSLSLWDVRQNPGNRSRSVRSGNQSTRVTRKDRLSQGRLGQLGFTVVRAAGSSRYATGDELPVLSTRRADRAGVAQW
jgi:hypothetical protein